MNIAFVSNFHKTEFYQSIAKRFPANEVQVFWFCFSNKHYNYLIENGYSASQILLLNRNIKKQHEVIGEYKLNELVWGDRILKYEFDWGLQFLMNIQVPFYNFVLSNSIQYIFGEMTYAHEILMNRICRDKLEGKCSYLHPQSIRIPNGRFTFMDTEFQDTIFRKSEYIQSESVLQSFELPVKPNPPQRVAEVALEVKKSMTISSRFGRIKRMFSEENIEKDHPSIKKNRFIRYKIAFKEEYNKFMYRFLKTLTFNEIAGAKYFYITLHMQPEASVDVVGRYNEDQFVFIRNIWRILPKDYIIIVKEHTNAIGNRSLHFYKECLKLKNVFFINEKIDAHTLIKGATAIFTNSGTVALEGALYQKDSFVLADIFFDKLQYCYKTTYEDLKKCKNFDDLLISKRETNAKKLALKEYSSYIIRSSYEGVIDPPTSSYLFSDTNNIDKIANSFLMFLRH